jgi:hypothetical protein
MKLSKFALLSSILSAGVFAVFIGCAAPDGNRQQIMLSENVSLYEPGQISSVDRNASETVAQTGARNELSAFLNDQKLTLEERLNSIEGLQKALANGYVGYRIKKSLIGISGDQIFSSCIKEEKQAAEPLEPLVFVDRIRKCLAKFQDAHLYIRSKKSESIVATGIALTRLIKGKVIIAQTRPQLLKKFEEFNPSLNGGLIEAIASGNEVVRIDGRPAIDVANDLEKYVPGSSRGVVRNQAVAALFARYFHYPDSSTVRLEIKTLSGQIKKVEMPWVQSPLSLPTPDYREHLNKKGILTERDKELMTRSGFDTQQPLFTNLVDKIEFMNASDPEQKLATMGQTQLNGHDVCYLQMYSFRGDQGDKAPYFPAPLIKNGRQVEQSFIASVTEFLKSCDHKNAPLIFDLKENGGGDPLMADYLFALFEAVDGPRLYRGNAYGLSRGNYVLLSNLLTKGFDVERDHFAGLLLKAYNEQRQSENKISPWIITRPNDAEQGAFKGKVYVLTSTQCMSACDIMAGNFKLTHRGTILGEPTNGTGFGVQGDMFATHTDPLNLFAIDIPNFAFAGTQVLDDSQFEKVGKTSSSIVPYEKIKLVENQPVVPDVSYQLTYKDMLDGTDYIKFLETTILKK